MSAEEGDYISEEREEEAKEEEEEEQGDREEGRERERKGRTTGGYGGRRERKLGGWMWVGEQRGWLACGRLCSVFVFAKRWRKRMQNSPLPHPRSPKSEAPMKRAPEYVLPVISLSFSQ